MAGSSAHKGGNLTLLFTALMQPERMDVDRLLISMQPGAATPRAPPARA